MRCTVATLATHSTLALLSRGVGDPCQRVVKQYQCQGTDEYAEHGEKGSSASATSQYRLPPMRPPRGAENDFVTERLARGAADDRSKDRAENEPRDEDWP
jgi:hypothetical protein